MSLIACSNGIAQTATVDCGAGAEPIVVRYFQEDTKKQTAKGMRIDFWRLLKHERCPDNGPCYVTGELSKRVTCIRSGDNYQFVFKPVPFNANLQGQCGARITGEVLARKNG